MKKWKSVFRVGNSTVCKVPGGQKIIKIKRSKKCALGRHFSIFVTFGCPIGSQGAPFLKKNVFCWGLNFWWFLGVWENIAQKFWIRLWWNLSKAKDHILKYRPIEKVWSLEGNKALSCWRIVLKMNSKNDEKSKFFKISFFRQKLSINQILLYEAPGR